MSAQREPSSPVALAITTGGIEFRNPVLTASGTFGYAREFEGLCDLTAIAGLVTKGISPKPRFGNRTPRICETASGMLNSTPAKVFDWSATVPRNTFCLSRKR